jgi:hypothetical protein
VSHRYYVTSYAGKTLSVVENPSTPTGGSQCASILRYLETGRAVSPLMALDKFGTLRLAARILELKQRGHSIATHKIKVGRKCYAAYLLDRA